MDKIFRGYATQRKRAIKTLIKRYGVGVKIYKPISANSAYTGDDEMMIYEDNPYFTGKILIPSILKIQQNSTYFDHLFNEDNDNYCYLPMEYSLYEKSKIIIDPNEDDLSNSEVYSDPQIVSEDHPRNLIPSDPNQMQIISFKIETLVSYDVNFSEIFRKYRIVPYYGAETEPKEHLEALYDIEESKAFPLEEMSEENMDKIGDEPDIVGSSYYRPLI